MGDPQYQTCFAGFDKIKNRVAQKKRSRQKSVVAVREEEVKLRGVGFVKEVVFKRAVKVSYRCTVVNQKRKM